MSKKLLFKLVALVACLLCSLGSAAAEAYANINFATASMTFYYDDLRSTRTGKTYDLNGAMYTPGWYNDGNYVYVEKVSFDSSFAVVYPRATSYWFAGMTLRRIYGLEYLNTSAVTNMKYMFHGCKITGSSPDLSHFNTANVTNMNSMFSGFSCFSSSSLDLSSFNTANVTDMDWMFYNDSTLTTITVGEVWNTDAVTTSYRMFLNCTSLVGGKGTTYDANHVDAAYAHIDGGPSNPGYLTDGREAYACYTPSDSTLTFYYDNLRSTRDGMTYDMNTGKNYPGWYSDNTCIKVTAVVFTSSFASVIPVSIYHWFASMKKLRSITGMKEYLNTANVTDMSGLFYNCNALTSLDLSGFNTANVTTMREMFENCTNLTSVDVSGFNTANVTSMHAMFCGCIALTSLDVTHFSTENVTNMSGMFYECSGLTSLDVSNFNTANVITMSNMFEKCCALTSLDVSSFNTSKVTDFRRMFAYCTHLTSLDVNNFNTDMATNMQRMFLNCELLTTLDLSNFNTAKVTDMSYMFFKCNKLTTIYVGQGWSTDIVTSSDAMFEFCTNLVGGQGTTYDANYVDKAYAHIDGGPSNPGYFTEPMEAYACYTPSNTTLTFYYDNLRSTRPGTTYDLNEGYDYPGWYSDGSNSSVTQAVFDPSFADARPTTTCGWFNNMKKLENITGMEYLNTSQVTKMSYMFYFCTSLTSLDLSNFNTANVTDMSRMFYQCRMTSLDLSNFNTANVTSMDYMFNYCLNLISLDVSGFNTAKVTDMEGMFNRCSSLTTIYGGDGWITSAVENSRMMFYNCTSLVGGQGTTYDVNHVDKAYAHIDGGPSNPGYLSAKPEPYANYTPDNTTLTFYYDGQRGNRPGMTYDLNTGNNIADWYDIRASVTKVVFDQLFADARPTTTSFWFCGMDNLSSITGMQYLCTSSVTSMDFMFYACSSLTELDLSSFNTESVKSMNSMLAYCRNLTSIYAGDGWTTDGVTTSNNMFISSYSLVGGKGTTYNANHVDKAYAHIDGGTSNPGYFSEKGSFLRGDVDNDGQVKISDVTALINYLLSGDVSGINLQAADCDQDGNIKIGDVTELINYLLSGSWN